MRVMRYAALCLLLALVSSVGSAAMYRWKDDDGAFHATDRLDRVPPKFQKVLKHDADHYIAPSGIGFKRNDDGDVNFFDHSTPARRTAKRKPPPDGFGPPGSPVSAAQFDEIKRRYIQSGIEPRPEVLDVKVRRIISGDTFELETGEKVTYIGIEFPEELKGETELHKESVEFQKKMMEGKKVHMILGKNGIDEKGRLLAYVFIGTDMFVNAELVMNGFARVNTVPPNTDYRKLFLRLENFAKESMLGMWDTGGKE